MIPHRNRTFDQKIDNPVLTSRLPYFLSRFKPLQAIPSPSPIPTPSPDPKPVRIPCLSHPLPQSPHDALPSQLSHTLPAQANLQPLHPLPHLPPFALLTSSSNFPSSCPVINLSTLNNPLDQLREPSLSPSPLPFSSPLLLSPSPLPSSRSRIFPPRRNLLLFHSSSLGQYIVAPMSQET
jgi:hypothetical protein